ncbi:LLM class flavin-dependent oxidoreductase [Halomonas organivorans]|uniref:Luciferase-like monooxygenase n=1 Tax=Halomonas organivorans TaxID=257772 RepID=A0A7W5G3Z5_9GAMM|nr:LLM class flavin-dependent oxidoreductase [Halomonas organivorans]MBB3139878.1 luciferase family oxidoreductase group 1 [Halomonas organivorans]
MARHETPLSLLDLAPIGEGFVAGEALENSTRLAQAAEKAGFKRYWLAEHHNLIDIASAATSVVLSHIGAKTSTIRLGSGGIMLPNHAPLMVAEQFGTLESFYPGRIDLGLGRAPGTDMATVKALRRDVRSNGMDFPEMVEELRGYLAPTQRGQRIQAIPGAGLKVPLWLLGSSTYSAQLAAVQGLPLAFASHFAPDAMQAAIDTYRSHFQPSDQLEAPYVIVCVNAVAAETQREAEYLATTELQKFMNLGRGVDKLLPKPVEDMSQLWHRIEERQVRHQLRESAWGTGEQVRTKLLDLAERTGADEVMINSWIHDPEARIDSHERIANAWFQR